MCRSRACATAMPGHPGAALGVGDVGGQPVGVDLLERERHGDDAGRRTRAPRPGWRRPAGDSPSSLPAHCARRAGQAQALQDRDVQRGQCADVPGLVVAAGRRGGRLGAAGGEHGDHQGVGACQRRPAARARRCAARRRRPAARRAAGVLDRVAQRLDEGGVAGQVLGAVVEDGDRRAVVVGAAARSSTPQVGVGHRRRRSRRPVSSTVSERKRVQLREVVRRRPGPGRRAPAAATPAGTVDSSISSASGACSPPSTTVGTPLASTASMPSCQAR